MVGEGGQALFSAGLPARGHYLVNFRALDGFDSSTTTTNTTTMLQDGEHPDRFRSSYGIPCYGVWTMAWYGIPRYSRT